ncbi:MAG: sensor histidine kinase [Candidatus Schekmanbacteria bacterium]|nr:sensor histidine kinase [Candidatus Schekmanbacteria bacterium]
MENKKNLLIIYGSIAVITFFHYYTSTGYHYFHDIYRRLYYIPIIFAAFIGGIRGGLCASIFTSMVYTPHAFWHMEHIDPARTVEKALEMVLYNVVALVTGVLATREKEEKERHRKTAQELEKSLLELKSMERELLRAEKLSAIGQLTAGLAHEIRNPLGSIQGAAEIISRDFTPENPKHKMTQILLKEVERLNKVLTNFLDFARPAPLELSPTDLNKELESVIKFFDPQAKLAGVVINKTGAALLPMLSLDRERMRQVFLNLLLNALQAISGSGEINCKIEQVSVKNKDYLAVTIEDSGDGISRENLANIFNPFFTTKKSGSGLGLAISYKIVQEHGGQIQVESQVGKGSSFTVFLPKG